MKVESNRILTGSGKPCVFTETKENDVHGLYAGMMDQAEWAQLIGQCEEMNYPKVEDAREKFDTLMHKALYGADLETIGREAGLEHTPSFARIVAEKREKERRERERAVVKKEKKKRGKK